MKPRPTILKIAQWGQLTTLLLPVYLAQEAGFLDKAGIRLKYIPIGNADEIVNAVADGSCDLAMSGPTMPALAEQAPYQMKVIASIVHRAAVHGLTANPVIHKIKTVQDFVGLRVATAPRPSTAYSIMAALKKRNRRLLKNMTLIEAPIGQQIEYVRRGEADLYIDQEPYVSAAEAKGYRVVFSAAEMFGPLSFTGLYGKTEILEAKKDAITVLCKAVAKACALIAAEPEKAAALTANIFKGLPPEIHRTAVMRLYASHVWPKNPVISKEAWNNAIGIRRDIGMRFVRNAWNVVDNSFNKA